MALLQKLKDVRITKQNYFVLQNRIYADMAKRWHYLLKVDMFDMTKSLEKELQYLLCSSLRYKSIKIGLTGRPRYSYDSSITKVNVERNHLGFYYPYSSRSGSDINLLSRNKSISKNDDIFTMDRNDNGKEKEKIIIALSELKLAGKRIIPEKLDIYFKFLREAMAYAPNFLCYTHEYNAMDKELFKNFKIGRLEFVLDSGNIIFASEEDEQSYHRMESIFDLLDYDDGGTFDPQMHDRLKLFIGNYGKIAEIFDREEKIKRKAYKVCSGMLEQMKKHTLAFKVLKEIKK